MTKFLCDQIFPSPIHVAQTANLPGTATGAIGFGPGGLTGVDNLTSRNLGVRGVRVIVVGEKSKNRVLCDQSQEGEVAKQVNLPGLRGDEVSALF